MGPFVSVVMNCYNSARFLREAIESVYAQTYTSWEIVLWDDASVDESPAIAQSYDDRLRYCHTKERVPLGEARNKAIAECRGDLVAFLDCDDVWMPEKLARQVPFFNDPAVALVYSDGHVIDETGRRLRRLFDAEPPERGRVFDSLIVRNFIPLVSAVMRRDVFAEVGVFRSFCYAEEYDLFLRIAARHPVDYVDASLALYRIHQGNFSRQGDVVYRESLQIREEWLSRLGSNAASTAKRIREVLRQVHANYGWWLLKEGRNREARREASESLRLGPWQIRPLLVYAGSLMPSVLSRPGLVALRSASGRRP